MPAIQPARLRQQAALLAESFHEPESFLRSLHHLMEFYADRAHRPGRSGTPAPLLPAYHVRPPVLRQLWLELAPHAREDPQAALRLCSALCDHGYQETRLLAIHLLGVIPVQDPDFILGKVNEWLGAKSDLLLVDAMLEHGFAGLRGSCPGVLLEQIEKWLQSDRQHEQRYGLRALLPFIRDPEFENMPVIFRLVTPYCRVIPSAGLRPDILDIIAALARRSPPETSFFLRELLYTPESPDTPWLVRNSLKSFPVQQQSSLRSKLREIERL
ncbi:MAG: DNA alkylation repair protein [Chloroflexi bacterium]|nr:DNA alkylation repair protein [Chloroflexota bacterium]